MTAEELNILLYEKMQNEQKEFMDNLLNSSPETIVEYAYEMVIREDILLSLEENELSPKQCKALLKEKEPLNKLFTSWEKHEGDHMKEILECIENTADELASLMKKREGRDSR